jgi:uncharacterized membrane protein YfcA
VTTGQWALLAFATLAGMTVQSAIGFGFALILAPALFTVLDPAEAVTCLLGLGLVINLAMLYAEKRPHRADRRMIVWLTVGALPGLIAGAYILAATSKSALQVAVGVVIVAAAFASTRRQPRFQTEPSIRGGVVCGTISGTMTTATGLNGPPLVLWIAGHTADPETTRDTITAGLLALNTLGVICLTATGSADYSSDGLTVLAVLLPAVFAGHQAGRLLFKRIAATDYTGVLRAGVVAAGAASIVAGLA